MHRSRSSKSLFQKSDKHIATRRSTPAYSSVEGNNIHNLNLTVNQLKEKVERLQVQNKSLKERVKQAQENAKLDYVLYEEKLSREKNNNLVLNTENQALKQQLKIWKESAIKTSKNQNKSVGSNSAIENKLSNLNRDVLLYKIENQKLTNLLEIERTNFKNVRAYYEDEIQSKQDYIDQLEKERSMQFKNPIHSKSQQTNISESPKLNLDIEKLTEEFNKEIQQTNAQMNLTQFSRRPNYEAYYNSSYGQPQNPHSSLSINPQEIYQNYASLFSNNSNTGPNDGFSLDGSNQEQISHENEEKYENEETIDENNNASNTQ